MDILTGTILIVVLLVVGSGLLVATRARRARTQGLRDHFGPEYERLVSRHGTERAAEAALLERRHRFRSLALKTLAERDRVRFGERWQLVQAHFVDDPQGSIGEGQQLVEEVMAARGYPLADWDQRQADISVERPDVVEHFRAARSIARRNAAGDASTEELRQALIHYRILFQGLLEGRASTQPQLRDEPASRRTTPRP